MKILHITEQWVCGGIEAVLTDLCSATSKRGVANELTHLYEVPERGAETGSLQSEALRMHRRFRLDPLGLRRLGQRIREKRPDVLHCHGYYAAASALALRPFRKIPLLYTVHSDLGSGKERSRAFVSGVLRRCDRVVAVSSSAAATVNGFTHGRVQADVVRNGIDPERMVMRPDFSAREKRRSEGLAENTQVLCCAAALTTQKDHTTLLKAFAQVQNKEPKLVLILLGDGPERARLQDLAASLHLQKCVKFLGARRDVNEWMAASCAFVLSSHAEGTPISIIEAACAGLPIAATAVGGIPALAKEGLDLHCAPANDVDGLVHAIKRALSAAQAEGFAPRRERARATLGIGAAADRYCSIYAELGAGGTA